MSRSRIQVALLAAICVVPFFALTLVVHAHTEETNISATIRAAILSDPRTAAMSEEEIHQMVDALAQGAETQGVSASDIMWRPQEEPQGFAQAEAVPTSEQCEVPEFLCILNNSLGLDGSDVAIPIGLGVSAALLLFVIGSLLHHTYGHHPVLGKLKSGV